MEKQWKVLVYQGKVYEQFKISNYGDLMNAKTGRIYKLRKNKNGYLCVSVSLGSRYNKITIRLHRAVAETFIPNPNNLPEVNHITGDKTKNEYWNLEWCTRQENQVHAVKTGLCNFDSISGTKNLFSKLSEEDVKWIRENYVPYDKKFGTRALGRKFGVHHRTIEQVIHKQSYKDI